MPGIKFPPAIIMEKSGQVDENSPFLPELQARESLAGCKRPCKLRDISVRKIGVNATLPRGAQSNTRLREKRGMSGFNEDIVGLNC